MYSHQPNGTGGAAGGSNINGGVQICVEPLCEWKIQEIAYDGFEKYNKPEDFKDVLRKNARRVNWRKIVGTAASLDAAQDEDESEEDESEQQQATSSSIEKQLSPAVSEQKQQANLFEPAAGPWASVGKHLHHALQEVHILLDALRISSRTYYLNPVVNALVQDERTESEQLNQSRTFQLYTRKKTLREASDLINRMLQHRQKPQMNTLDGSGAGFEAAEDGTGNFTKELRELREHWRIRKVGSAIYGDLGYKTYVPKFAPHELFDVVQKSESARRLSTLRHSNPSYIGLRVPHNLRFRTRLCVFVEPDSEEAAQSLYKSAPMGAPKSAQAADDEEVRHFHWRRLLPWAQETLICKDLLAQLKAESVGQQQMISVNTEQSIAISLFDGLLLRVELHFFPLQDLQQGILPPPPPNAIPFLSQTLRELFLAEHTNRPKRNQQFVTLPQTALPPGLDMRGPQALSAEEISARMRPSVPLIRKFVDCSAHYVLVSRTVEFLQAYMSRFTDPQPQWKWVRATSNFSLISLNFSNRGFENLGKFSSHIRIAGAQVWLHSKEGQQIACRRDMQILGEALLLLTAHFLVNTLNILSRAYGWQIFHANVNAFDAGGNPAPTFYACNQQATKNLFIQFHTDGQSPDIFIREQPIATQPSSASTSTSGAASQLEGFHKLDYAKVPGSTFMRKIDTLLAAFI